MDVSQNKKRSKPSNRLPAKRKDPPPTTTAATAAGANPPSAGARPPTTSAPIPVSTPPAVANAAPGLGSASAPATAPAPGATPKTKYDKDVCPLSDAGLQVDLDSNQPYNIDPVAPVPPCKKPRPSPPGARTQSTKDILGWDSQHPYVERWVRMSLLERCGDVKFQVVRNDGQRDSLLLVLALKNVFVKQLPNMPRPYVSRLVFDRKHESLALLKMDEKVKKHVVMGGCCYRPFKEQGFAEIAFLAISQSEQVRGYGTRLMAQTKERAKRLGLTHLLTCADNNAVPYFKKQGFSKKITLPFDRWQGYIKDYDGVTLMECILHTKVDYLKIPMLLKAQKMALVEKMKEISNSHIVYPGIDVTARRGLRIEDIPGLKDIGSSGRDAAGGTSATRAVPTAGFADRDSLSQENLRKHLQSILAQIKAHNCAWPFLEPVNAKDTGAYDYYDVVKNPMDLGTIQERLDSGWFYVTKEIFIADLKRMVRNCVEYNGKTHYVTDMALQLEKVFLNKI
jgi:histone acetyltransferase